MEGAGARSPHTAGAGSNLRGGDGRTSRPRERSASGRVPPHNLEAEQAVIGAALVAADAAEVLTSTLNPGDFYSPNHQHAAAAVAELVAGAEPVDVVTVAEELRRAGVLELVGGVQYLLELQALTPSIGRAAAYARIVKDAAVLRRLISTAADIAELGYAAHDDPTTAVHRAGELLSRMGTADAARLSTLEIPDIAALLASDLTPEQPTLFARSDGAALFYGGKIHTLQAEPSSGKSWIALGIVAEVLDAGGAAVYVDYEDTSTGILGRLRTLSVPTDSLAARFRYMQIPGRFGPAERLALDQLLAELNPDVVVIDGVGEALSREGLSEDKADDVLRWTDLIPRPIARTGAAVVMIDHVAKDPEQRGRWARGSGAKLGAIDGAAYQVKVRAAFSRHRAGRVDLVVAKDRPGGVGAIGETVATIHIEPSGAGELVRLRVEPPATTAPTDSWKPTRLMAKVAEVIAEASGALTASAIPALVHAHKPALVREALTRLIAEGYVAETGRPKRLTVVKPYTEEGAPAGPPPPAPEPPAGLFDDDEPRELTDEELAAADQYAHNYYDDPNF